MTGVDSIHDIYVSLRGSLARAVLGIVPPKEIEDIVQETYVRVCQIEKYGTSMVRECPTDQADETLQVVTGSKLTFSKRALSKFARNNKF